MKFKKFVAQEAEKDYVRNYLDMSWVETNRLNHGGSGLGFTSPFVTNSAPNIFRFA